MCVACSFALCYSIQSIVPSDSQYNMHLHRGIIVKSLKNVTRLCQLIANPQNIVLSPFTDTDSFLCAVEDWAFVEHMKRWCSTSVTVYAVTASALTQIYLLDVVQKECS